MSSPLLEIRNLHKTYHMGDSTVKALDGISLNVQKGDFWALLGSSGSGKSTLLNMIGCLDTPCSGEYFIKGTNTSTMNDDQLSELRLRQIGFIFQSFNLIPQLTVAENIALPLFYQGWEDSKSHAKALELAKLVELEHRIDHLPKELSGGQQQRVAIARALANDPSIILADEPTGALDSTTSEQIMTLLSELNKQGITIIMVTHEADIAEYASYKLYMRDGKVEKTEGRR